MSDNRTAEFIQYHRPDLKSGDYTIQIQHQVDLGFGDTDSFSETKTLSVRGERFKIASEEIVACFPPDGSFGDFSNCLPHIVISKSTLPWERTAGTETSGTPWLAVLLIDSSEFSQVKTDTVTIGNLGWPLESGDSASDSCQTLSISRKILDSIIPLESEINRLTHVRLVETSDKATATEDGPGEFAVVVGNRIGKPGSVSTAYLVSLEGYYDPVINSRYAPDSTGNVTLVLLSKWSFSAESEQFTFKHLVSNLNRNPSTPRLPDLPGLSMIAQNMVKSGHLPLPHRLRQGDKTVSWYRGPLVPYSVPITMTFPASTSDELTLYDSNNGVFTLSYSAAWELGRLLGLQSRSFSMALYRWKLSQKRQDILAAEKALISRLFGDPSFAASDAASGSDWQDIINDWLGKLSLLIGVPFSYLVPDERMLPMESIRFFELDTNWVDSLIDGAFSIGRSTAGDLASDQKTASSIRQSAAQTSLTVRKSSPGTNPSPLVPQKIAGVLLRSSAVAGWPNLEIRGYATPQKDANNLATDQLTCLRMDHLSKDVILCLFAGELLQVDIQLPSEGVHFGLDFDQTFSKELRDPNGDLETTLILNNIPFRDHDGVLNIDLLANEIAQKLNVTADQLTSAQFAMQMVEGVDKISFLKTQE
ncbi:hypothetical protein LEP1GSC047_2131 [Leptospira inadai serovar Lyme str. 10]|uniref:Uncharacterized protein n=2 Tax=Leptospira inadai serovar Lyme TaxID=293084 RepID=V6HEC0_9LEPT|nr:hypothetical protein [Leptospira inadai]EQA38706.1 hypothetical protein LEP1GSC047_2131 [Leptospira inadai serovar Lyme str. 10]PNV72636.1 hypothetical protein BES34_018935 [Leptospira inadai serovar Lyme]